MEYPQLPPTATYAAAAPTAPPHSMPVAVVGPQYCCPYPVDLAIFRKARPFVDGFIVTDLNGNVVFYVQSFPRSSRNRRVILDAAEIPVVTLRRKLLSWHGRWQAFRGDSSDPKDLIFTVKRSSLIQFIGAKLNVFLASNTSEQVCDFKSKGSWWARSCVVYAGESNTIVAQMRNKHTFEGLVLGERTFMVTVYPNVDYAFIAALILIQDRINSIDGRRR